MKFLYFLDCYADGGAELGLATLVENGFFENHEVSICAMTGKGTSYERLKASSIPRHVLRFCGTRPFNTWSVLLSIFPLLRFIWRERPAIPRFIEEPGEISCGFRLDGFCCAHDSVWLPQ